MVELRVANMGGENGELANVGGEGGGTSSCGRGGWWNWLMWEGRVVELAGMAGEGG